MLIFLNPLILQQRWFMKNFPVLRVVKCPKRPLRETEISIIRGFKEQITRTAVKGSSEIHDPAFKQRGGQGDLLGSLSRILPLFCTTPAKSSTLRCLLPVTPSAVGGSTRCIAVLSISFPLQSHRSN